jgi:hypothetical protein
MKIGFAVQGSTDRAFVTGLRDRWCPDADLQEGAFRGSTGLSLRRELAKICRDLFNEKGCDLIVFLSDADVADWREVQRHEVAKLPDGLSGFAVYGMADRNIECWLCADPHYVARETARNADDFRVHDPKGAFESGLGINRDEKREERVSALVSNAPVDVLKNWMRNPSFEDFYDQLWAFSRRRGCQIENLRESAGCSTCGSS